MTHEWDSGGSHQWNMRHGERRRAPGLWLVWILALAFVVVAGISIARAAERTLPGPHAIAIYYHGKDYGEVRLTHITISGAYPSHDKCMEAIKRVRLVMVGAKLRCDPVEGERIGSLPAAP
jgi:hypothetical protein